MTNFNIDFVSDLEREHLVAEISFLGQRLCVIDKENGDESMEIEFLVDLYILPESIKMKFKLSDFENAIFAAKTDLAKCK
ncbi:MULTISPECIES: hypothetical protein [unclassified Cupriavidus]|uniref:hypothetical protein n=1 Tax=unclassified Cupriavidus TaxID=2640874 RepID=UPI001C002542|nr:MULTISPECIES: hypothetical protein [unclassified Cupriavidus]MCA3193507.1 hypothetical protein [Cupriavidus sp.]MCA3199033.1 hypothetical protein [Cupriavidus sp.]MCA3203384.1 hypothetical protein [Cupriavidus sp.]MCA3206091.1 hypothetical protein [Cupriavidus sp.]MCA3234647.1 hypothetical protein [Cupriavidus sp.]